MAVHGRTSPHPHAVYARLPTPTRVRTRDDPLFRASHRSVSSCGSTIASHVPCKRGSSCHSTSACRRCLSLEIDEEGGLETSFNVQRIEIDQSSRYRG
eukprot:scaffold911_cov314-Pavlova_lutheri.AAC.18